MIRTRKILTDWFRFITSSMFIFLALPYSDNYSLKSLNVGGNGGGVTDSEDYSAEIILDDIGTSYNLSSDNNSLRSGLIGMQESDVSYVLLSNTDQNGLSDRLYDRLKLVVNHVGPDDTSYLLSISDDNWTTSNYLTINGSFLHTSLVPTWYSYADLGGIGGIYIVGLISNTSYSVRLKTRDGDYTEGPWGPESTASTTSPTITFDIDHGADCSSIDNDGPHIINFDNLNFSSISTTDNKLCLDLDSNAQSGVNIEIKSQYAGLYSPINNYTISSESELLTTDSNTDDGYGLQAGDFTSSFGLFDKSTVFDQTGDNVGYLPTYFTSLATTAGQQIVDGRGELSVLAVASRSTPAGRDYIDTITIRVIAEY